MASAASATAPMTGLMKPSYAMTRGVGRPHGRRSNEHASGTPYKYEAGGARRPSPPNAARDESADEGGLGPRSHRHVDRVALALHQHQRGTALGRGDRGPHVGCGTDGLAVDLGQDVALAKAGVGRRSA